MSDNLLSSMNNIDDLNLLQKLLTSTVPNSVNKFKTLIIGNSITYHPIAENIGWNQANGMAATAQNKDYANILLASISAKLAGTVEMKLVNMADWERSFKDFDLDDIKHLLEYKPNLIIFQLGENVTFRSVEDMNIFGNKYAQMVTLFKSVNNPIVICTSPFFPSLEKNEIIKQICINTDSLFVDLSHLALLDKTNFAYSERDYSNKGIGIHPGNKGMKSIATAIFIAINPFLCQNR